MINTRRIHQDFEVSRLLRSTGDEGFEAIGFTEVEGVNGCPPSLIPDRARRLF
jgi:hypothetical protein